MYLVRYRRPDGAEPRVGVEGADGVLRELAVPDLPDLLGRDLGEIRSIVEDSGAEITGPVTFLPPVAGRTEVWAAGVTYERSRDARIEETQVADVYQRVYDAERPELFFKAAAWRVCTDGDPIGIREDSALNVPEPELAVVATAHGQPVGYTIANDVSSRTIEGLNPLYLPQAKIYAGACALHHRIRPSWEVPDPYALAISSAVTRGGAEVWTGRTTTAQLHRRIDDLLDWAFRADLHPDGMVLSTGTGLIPGFDVTLLPGDVVRIAIDGIGELVNHVVLGLDPFRSHRTPAAADRRQG